MFHVSSPSLFHVIFHLSNTLILPLFYFSSLSLLLDFVLPFTLLMSMMCSLFMGLQTEETRTDMRSEVLQANNYSSSHGSGVVSPTDLASESFGFVMFSHSFTFNPEVFFPMWEHVKFRLFCFSQRFLIPCLGLFYLFFMWV